MRLRAVVALLLLVLVPSCAPPDAVERDPFDVIAFGSCARQDLPQPIWDAVLAADPDLFVFLGDNVYGDTQDMDTLRSRYGQLAAQPGFSELRSRVPIMATWDDHDYGTDDVGGWYPAKDSSQAVFMDFWDIPQDAPMRSHPGVYSAATFGEEGRRVQVVLLDTRYYRDRFEVDSDQSEEVRALGFGPYVPTEDTSRTMLGERQWSWLADRLREPADVRLIGSSVQVIAGDHGWEAWSQMPHEKRRLYDLIRETGAEGVTVISGDTHWAEISADTRAPYTLYDVTSSALNQEWPQALNLPNRNRASATAYPYPNFGLIRIDWEERTITFEIRDEEGKTVLGYGVRLETLR